MTQARKGVPEGQLPLPIDTGPAGGVLTPVARALLSLHAAWADVLSATGDLPELVAATLISARISRALGTGPLWLLFVGVPSSGKTEAVSAAKHVPATYYLDTLTENSFISGYVPQTGNAQDMLAELKGRTLVVKDMTALFSLKDDVVKKVLGDLCAIYDGSFAKYTGTRGLVTYESVFPFLACITPHAIERHGRHMSMIGPRFLLYRLPELREEQRVEAEHIVWSRSDQKELQSSLAEAMRNVFVTVEKEAPPMVQAEPIHQELLNRLADLLACGRAVVGYARVGNNWEPDTVQREEPWRALQQLRVLAIALAQVHGRNRLTYHELEMARSVVLSTMSSARADVLAMFQGSNKPGLTINQCTEALSKSSRRVNQLLQELMLAGVVIRMGKVGKEHLYAPAPQFDDLLRRPIQPLDHIADLALQGVQSTAASATDAISYSSPRRG